MKFYVMDQQKLMHNRMEGKMCMAQRPQQKETSCKRFLQNKFNRNYDLKRVSNMKSEISHVCVCRMQVKVLQCEPNLNRHLNTMLTEKIMSHVKILHHM